MMSGKRMTIVSVVCAVALTLSCVPACQALPIWDIMQRDQNQSSGQSSGGSDGSSGTDTAMMILGITAAVTVVTVGVVYLLMRDSRSYEKTTSSLQITTPFAQAPGALNNAEAFGLKPLIDVRSISNNQGLDVVAGIGWSKAF